MFGECVNFIWQKLYKLLFTKDKMVIFNPFIIFSIALFTFYANSLIKILTIALTIKTYI